MIRSVESLPAGTGRFFFTLNQFCSLNSNIMDEEVKVEGAEGDETVVAPEAPVEGEEVAAEEAPVTEEAAEAAE